MNTNIVLKLNNAAVNDPCEMCGKRTDPVIGVELFAENTGGIICASCADAHAPALKQARDILAEEANFIKIYPDFFPSSKRELTYINVCFNCGSSKDLRPFESMWGTWHICRKCEIEAAQAQAIRAEQAKQKRGK